VNCCRRMPGTRPGRNARKLKLRHRTRIELH
jgi:hypothetical protein